MKNNYQLHVRGLKLNVNLGWRNQERQEGQGVLLDIIIQFENSPLACTSDELEDTICYATLAQHIRNHIHNKHYRLIEHLTAEIYNLIKTVLSPTDKLRISLTKYPKVDGLTGGVVFTYGDE